MRVQIGVCCYEVYFRVLLLPKSGIAPQDSISVQCEFSHQLSEAMTSHAPFILPLPVLGSATLRLGTIGDQGLRRYATFRTPVISLSPARVFYL